MTESDISILTWASFGGVILFAYLWRATPPDSEYETGECGMVRTRTAFLACGLTCLALWATLLRLGHP